MELLAFAKEVAQNLVEHAVSYKLVQTALRQVDRALWVVEECARWAVPPPLDQDDRPQPELVRPLPWVFFITLLVTLRVTRESVSLVNLVRGKPPLRSADVVTYIEGKRRYIRVLHYKGTRRCRARAALAPAREPWYSGFQSLFEFTMCFRRSLYGNNNTTRISNNDEVLVVKRKRRQPAERGAVGGEAAMERLIEKMMVDLDAESDDDSSFTLTNATSARSDQSDSEPDPNDSETRAEPQQSDGTLKSPKSNENSHDNTTENNVSESDVVRSTEEETQPIAREESPPKSFTSSTPEKNSATEKSEPSMNISLGVEANEPSIEQPISPKKHSPKEESKAFIQSERCSPQKGQSSKSTKIANGRPMNASNKKRGLQTPRSSEKPQALETSVDGAN